MTHTLPHEWLGIHARAHPEARAVTSADGAISYAELDRRVNAHAEALREEGVEPGDVVPVVATLTLEIIVALVAIPLLGAVPAPYGPHRVDTNGAVVGEAYAIVPTSGSAGHPRGVVLTPGNVVAAVEASRRRLGNGSQDRWLLTLPLFHVGGLSVVWRSLTAGGSVELHEGFDAVAVARSLKGRAVSMVSLVPTMLHRILEVEPGPYDGIKGVLLGGAPASRHLVERGLAAGLPILQTYGMTETCSQVSTVEPGKERESLGTAGHVLDGFTLSLDDGEILLDGPAISPGYIGEVPRIGPYRTGDLGEFDDEGRLIIVGRTDDVIVTGGENVHASVVESAIEAHPAVSHAVVVAVDDDEWGEIVVAVVEAEHSAATAVREATEQRLARHEIPKRWVFVGQLPLLPSGKPDRQSARVEAVKELGFSPDEV